MYSVQLHIISKQMHMCMRPYICARGKTHNYILNNTSIYLPTYLFIFNIFLYLYTYEYMQTTAEDLLSRVNPTPSLKVPQSGSRTKQSSITLMVEAHGRATNGMHAGIQHARLDKYVYIYAIICIYMYMYLYIYMCVYNGILI